MLNNKVVKRLFVGCIVLLTIFVLDNWRGQQRVYASQLIHQKVSHTAAAVNPTVQIFLPMIVANKGNGSDLPVLMNQTPLPTPTPTMLMTPPPLATPTLGFSGWQALYFANPNLAGEPVWFENAPTLNFNWGGRSPDSRVSADGFSARFERVFTLPPGFYRIFTQADDGVRVFVDGDLVINAWSGSTGLTYIAERALAGSVTVRVEYFEVSGLAFITFAYEYLGDSAAWSATYFASADLSGEPRLSQDEPRAYRYFLDHDWLDSNPIATETWSARWVGRFIFERGDYDFYVRANGGVRVYLNEYRLIDAWESGYKEKTNSFRDVGGETHTITVEYYGRQGIGSLQVWWRQR